jgi:hypothetical protein
MDPVPDPAIFVRGMDPRIRIRPQNFMDPQHWLQLLKSAGWVGTWLRTPRRNSCVSWGERWDGWCHGWGTRKTSGSRRSSCQTHTKNPYLVYGMRSSLVICQCTSYNGPGFDPSIRRHSRIWGAADKAMLNILRKNKNFPPPKIFFFKLFSLY